MPCREERVAHAPPRHRHVSSEIGKVTRPGREKSLPVTNLTTTKPTNQLIPEASYRGFRIKNKILMKNLHIATEDGKNARVLLHRGRSTTPKVVMVTADGQETTTRTVHRGNKALELDKIDSKALIEGDPEIDFKHIGKFLPESSKAFRLPNSEQLEGSFQSFVTLLAPDGTIKDKSPFVPKKANINDTNPVKITKRMPLIEAFQKFVFNNHYCLGHEDGIQHDFLLALAKDLESKNEMALLGAGAKGNQPLVFRDSGTPTRAFLMGETDGDQYRLRLLLTRQELKMPESRLVETPSTETPNED